MVRSFDLNGEKFEAHSEVVDTEYGPEMQVKFYNAAGEHVSTFQEAMKVDGIIEMFKNVQANEYDDPCDEMEYEDGMTDAEADADTFRSIGWGTDEDYGYYDDNDLGSYDSFGDE